MYADWGSEWFRKGFRLPAPPLLRATLRSLSPNVSNNHRQLIRLYAGIAGNKRSAIGRNGVISTMYKALHNG